VTQKISRAQWEQIRKRVQMVKFVFDPSWKCLIDGKAWLQCRDHTEDDMERIIEQIKERYGTSLST